MAGRGRIVRQAGKSGPAGVDVDYGDVADGSDLDGADAMIAAEDAAARSGADDARASQVAELFNSSPQFASAFPNFIRTVVETGAPQEMDLLRSVLQKIDAATPGRSLELLNQIGNPESLTQEFAAGGDAPKPKWVRPGDSVPRSERVNTYVGGVANDIDKLYDPRSKLSRIENAGPGSLTSQQNMARYILSPSSYRRGRDAQMQQLQEAILTPEIIGLLTPEQRSLLTGVAPDQLTPEVLQRFYGATLPESLATKMPTAQRDAIVGPAGFGEANFATDAGGMTDGFEENRRMMSTRDQVLNKMINAAESGGTVPLAAHFKWWRLPWSKSEGGQIIRPDQAPTGDFMSRLARSSMKTQNFENWVPMMAPMLERSIREQAHLAPSTELFRGNGKRTEADYAQMRLPGERNDFYVRQLEGNMPFQQFMDDVTVNRGPKEPLNLGGLLLDRPAADAMDQPISTPDAAPMAPEAVDPEVVPADDELGMYDPRMMNPSVLAALMA